jgi:hypothetical protein
VTALFVEIDSEVDPSEAGYMADQEQLTMLKEGIAFWNGLLPATFLVYHDMVLLMISVPTMTCVQHRSRPREERGLLKHILGWGKICSTKRIISGLSLGILVSEAPKQSGALITANFALEQGRDVFAVPNGIYSPGSVGVNKLIQEGAHLVTDVQDILMELNLFMIPQHIEMQIALPDNSEESTLLSLLSRNPCHVDEIIRQSALPTMTVTSTLMMMEIKGMIKQVGGMQYVLAR